MIEVHYWPTPNGKKVTILLEELGTPYTIVPVNIGRGDQFSDGFLGISPNNRMPAIVDTAPKGGGAPMVSTTAPPACRASRPPACISTRRSGQARSAFAR